MHHAQAIATIDQVKFFWQGPEGVDRPKDAETLKSLPNPASQYKHCRWQRGWGFLRWTLATNRALERAIAEVQPDAVMLPAWSEYFAPLWAHWFRKWRQRGVRFGAVIHDPVRDHYGLGQRAHRISLAQAYSFLDVAFVHETIKLDAAGAQQPETIVVPHGPYPVEESPVNKARLREEMGIPVEADVLLSFGHIRDGKCLEEILKALVACPNCHLIVAGREQSGGQKPAQFYKDLAISLGVSKRCHWFTCYIPKKEVYRFFRVADRLLLLYSSDFHSMSGVLNVNAQFQLPVLASAGGGPLLKAVRDYNLGSILENAKPQTIAHGLRAKDNPIAHWEDYTRDHSWETNAQRVVTAFEAL